MAWRLDIEQTHAVVFNRRGKAMQGTGAWALLIAVSVLACGSDATTDDLSEQEQRASERCEMLKAPEDCAPDRYENCLACNRSCE